jgi:chromosome segregation ATPase
MEKNIPRTRRNGDGPDKNAANNVNLPAATNAPTTAIEGAVPTSPVQEARQRIQMAAGAIGNERPAARHSLQDTFVDERNDVLAVINELEDQLDRHQEIRETLERELAEKSEQLQAANQRAQESEWRVVTLQTRAEALEQIRGEVNALEEELADAAARAQRTNEQLLAAEKDRGRLKADLKATQKQLDELWTVGKERDGLRTECKTLSTKVEELERTQREALSERTAVQTQLQEAQVALEETTTERNKLQTGLRTAEDRIHELTQVQDALDDKIETLRNEKKNLQVQVAHLERENTRLVEQRQFYECEATALRNQSRAAEAALSSVKKAFSEVRIALTETKTRARRRTLDSWPRIGTPLGGLPEQITPAVEGQEVPDTAPTSSETLNLCAAALNGDVDLEDAAGR